MKKVFKYPIKTGDLIKVELPKGAQLLTVQIQHGAFQLWALIDPEETQKEIRVIRMAGTGHSIEGFPAYISSVPMDGGDLVFHFFETSLTLSNALRLGGFA